MNTMNKIKKGAIKKTKTKLIVEDSSSYQENNQLTIVETFVGAGGAHLGFKNAGFKSLLVNDIDKDTIDTLLLNKVIDENEYLLCPIENITQELILSKIGDKNVDVLFGGIVCKGFSLAGVRNPFDPRNYLYKHQLRLVDILKPKVSVIENVTSIKNMILYVNCEETVKTFEDYTKLSDANKLLNGEKSSKRKNGEDYSELNLIINKNKKNMEELLKGIDKYKYCVLDDIKQKYLDLGYRFYEKILQTDKYGGYTNRKRIIMVAVRNDIEGEYLYPEEQSTNYTLNDALKLIDYTGINNATVDEDNKPMKHNQKTVDRFKLIPEGNNIADVIDELPDELKISAFYSRGNTQRLNRNLPAPTLVPGHSNFPIHPWEHRSITVREAATITGFPLDYKFCGSHTSRCIQIGNAVPVQLSYNIALSIKKLLNK
uniref:DNA (cytosine-5-)-methyltransferase n=1 Tax=viral metagenome TaxID=1070528 RepID=A0A6C0KTK2_9ZZZZ